MIEIKVKELAVVNFSKCSDDALKSIEGLRRLTVYGRLDLYQSKIKRIPDNTMVEGILSIDYCRKIENLPTGLVVGGNLELQESTHIRNLPEDLLVGGNMNLRGCSLIKSLPKGLRFSGIIFCDSSTGFSDETIWGRNWRHHIPDHLKDKCWK